MTHNLITITNGVTRHPDYRLAEPLNLTIEAGKCYAICGQNGAGKSSLLRVAAGLLRPLAGTVEAAPCALADERPALGARRTIKLSGSVLTSTIQLRPAS